MTAKPSRVLLALLVLLGTTTFAPPAQAIPNEIYTEYYDCNVVFIGFHLLECNLNVTTGGSQSGTFKRVEKTRCNGTLTTVEWYFCTGGSCTLMSSPPTPPPPYYC